jgi:hypothetical protein
MEGSAFDFQDAELSGSSRGWIGDRCIEAMNGIEAAEKAILGVQKAAVDHASDPHSSPTPAMTVREAREALSDANEFYASLKESRRALELARGDLRSSVQIHEELVATAVSRLVAQSASGRIHSLIEAYAEVS